MRRGAVGALLIGLGISLGGCATAPAPAREDVLIVMERTPCFGFCPDYRVEITGAGAVTFTGRTHVAQRGEHRATIPREAVEGLLTEFHNIYFFNLRDEYRANVTDLPTTTLTLTEGARTKTLVDYGGTAVDMPESVRALQDEMDRVAGTARWIGDGGRSKER